MRLKNTTNIPKELIQEVIRFVRPSGISNFNIWVKNSKKILAGTAYHSGKVVIRVGSDKDFPFTYQNRKGGYTLTNGLTIQNRIEALVYIMAHELRHVWQGGTTTRRLSGGYGKYSERDACAYGIKKLEEWRKVAQVDQTYLSKAIVKWEGKPFYYLNNK